MKNKYPGTCIRCAREVEAGDGECSKSPSGRWQVQHSRCPAPKAVVNSSPPSAPAPVDPTEAAKKYGRTPVTGSKPVAFDARLDYRGKRAGAEAAMPKRGSIRRVKGVRYVMVDVSSPSFMSSEYLEDMDRFQDEAGWYYSWTGVAIEPTESEVQADKAKAREVADRAAIAAARQAISPETFAAAGELTDPLSVEQQKSASLVISETATSTTTTAHFGTTALWVVGEDVWYRHPGHYDDYIEMWKLVRGGAADLAARIDALTAIDPTAKAGKVQHVSVDGRKTIRIEIDRRAVEGVRS